MVDDSTLLKDLTWAADRLVANLRANKVPIPVDCIESFSALAAQVRTVHQAWDVEAKQSHSEVTRHAGPEIYSDDIPRCLHSALYEWKEAGGPLEYVVLEISNMILDALAKARRGDVRQ